LPQPLDDHGRALATGDDADVAGVGLEHLAQHVLVGIGVRRDNHRSAARQRELAEALTEGLRAEHLDAELRVPAKDRERLEDGTVPDEREQRLRQIGFHVDLQRAAAVTRHRILDDPLGASFARGASAAAHGDEPWLAVAQRVARLANDHRLGTRTSDPAFHRAVLEHERLGA
jgi:hypothetical protein